MKKLARPLLLAFAVLGLIASISSLYVHYRLYNDPSYVSFCDINETVSCEQVLQSAYSTVGGIPVASFGAIWAAAVLLLAWQGMKSPANAPVTAGYIFLLSTAGLAVVLYLGYASFFEIGRACPLCMAMYAAVIGTFVVSGAAASAPLGSLPGRIGRDASAVLASSTGTTLVAGFAVAAIALLVFFPRVEPVAQGATLAIPGAPVETLTADEVAQFGQFLDAQPRVPLPVAADGAKVVVVKFNDYQCPACRATYLEYKWIQDKYENNPDVKFVSLDFPLEAECGVGAIHPSACEAAVAVRLAKQRDRGEEMEQWLFLNQPQLTPDLVKQGVREVAGVTDFDARYQQVLAEVRADSKLGVDLNIESTPTFFINGMKLSSMRGIYFDAAIQHELKKAAPATP
jgi:uncharacterized membrane protein